MGSLALLIRVPHLHEVISAGARVDVLPLDISPRQKASGPAERTANAREKHGLMVDILPAGSQEAAGRPLGTFEPGRYLVRAELPSGEVLEESVEITGDQTTHVTLEAEPSPHEWLAFAQTTGATRTPSWSREAASHLKFTMRRVIDSLILESFDTLDSRGRLACVPLTADASNWTRVLSAGPWSSAGSEPWMSRDTDSVTRMWTRLAFEEHGLDALFVDAPDNDWLLVAPRGWRRVIPPDDNMPSRIELALAVREESPAVQGPSLYVADPDLAPVMAWMRRGRVDVAAEILRRMARALLQEKITNAYAAALGAYILCDAPSATSASGIPHALWIRNLDQEFPWLPDGAITHTLALMQTVTSDEGIDKALLAAIRAYERGIPLYTLGVQRLLDTLLMLREHVATGRTSTGVTVEAHDARVRAVRAVLGRMRTDRVFTSIRMPVTEAFDGRFIP